MSNKDNSFEYTYSSKMQKEVETIRSKYVNKEEDKLEQLKKLDKNAEKPGMIISITIGVIGTLLFGIGLTLCLEFSEIQLIKGIFIGIVGLAILSTALPCYKYITKKQREKIAPQILALTEELLKK